jgi:hypothetical protein
VTIRLFSLALATALVCALPSTARAQTPRLSTVNISARPDGVHVAAEGDLAELRMDVADESGEVVFQSGPAPVQSLEWDMRDARGERVAPGAYLVTVTYRTPGGKLRKRVEQVAVEEAVTDASGSSAAGPAPEESLTSVPVKAIGTVNVGRVPKFVSAGTTEAGIGNSVITESAGKIGVNVAPTATLQANGLQPASKATTGTPAPTLLQTSGGKGGNTTGTTGQVAGAGAGISLAAGIGGDAPAGSKRGNGGSIILQPGSTGAGAGTAGLSGNVLIAPSGVGNVAIGAGSATSRLTVNGMIQTTGAGGGVKFPDNSVQTKAGLSAVQHDATLAGAGTLASPLSLGVPLNLSGAVINGGVIRGENSSDGGINPFPIAAGVYGKGAVNGLYGEGGDHGVYGKGGSYGVYGYSDGFGVQGESGSGNGVRGYSNTGTGVAGFSSSGYAGLFSGKGMFTGNLEIGGEEFFGTTTRQMINLYGTTYGIGVQFGTQYFRSDLHFGWYRDGVHSGAELDPGSGGVRLMYLDASGKLTVLANVCAANIPCSSDARLKQGVSNLNYGLDQLLRLRPVSWRWKSEPEGRLQLGLVAQEVEGVMPELVTRDEGATKPLGLNYMALLPVAVKAIQEQQAQIQEQQKLIEQQARRNEQQSRQVEQLQTQLLRQQAQLDQVRRAVRRRAARR